MSYYLSTLKKTRETLSFYFNKSSEPHPKYFPDKVLNDTEQNRNKALILIQMFAFLGFIINIIIKNGAIEPNIHGLVTTTLIASLLIFSCHKRWHPQVFKIIYNLYVFLFGLLLLKYGDHGILGAWIAVPIFPLIVYFITGSFRHFLLNVSLQTICLNTLYQDLMRKSLVFLTIDENVKALTYYTHQNVQYTFLFIALVHYTTNSAVDKANVAEKQKDSFEKQKNFLLGFSHELRNLINSLMGNVKLAVLESPSDKIKDFLFNADVCGELLLHLVNNILDTGKVEIGELEINPAPRRIYDTMERIWGICSELIKRKNLQGRMKIQKDIPEILVMDHYRITQILMNLVGNAVKYTDSGYIDISVEWIDETEAIKEKCFQPYPFNDNDDHEEGIFEKNQALSVFDSNFTFLNFSTRKIDRNLLSKSVESKKGILKISITDSGCGILREDLTKIFERFTQGTTDPSKSKLGTGLGLFITKELCRKMDGEIRVFSKRHAGSAFTVCLPLEPVRNERAFFFDLAGIQRVIAEQKKLRAMIVDDENLSQFILKDFLNKLNVDVVDVAENGQVAHQKFQEQVLRKEYVNIVTMDLTMPVMDGKAAAQKIREIERARNLEPCFMIIVSGNCSESEIQECLDKNGKIRADAFVKKPVSVDELCRIISNHFGHIFDKQRVRLLAE